MIKITNEFLLPVLNESKSSPRRRKNYNFHKEDQDTLQRMINVLQKDSYCRPHKHINPDKREAFIILKGRVLFVEFDESGNVSDHIILNASSGNYGAEITPKSYHTIIPLEDNIVLYEIKDGPYDPKTDKIFATWAPAEGDEKGQDYINQIIKKMV